MLGDGLKPLLNGYGVQASAGVQADDRCVRVSVNIGYCCRTTEHTDLSTLLEVLTRIEDLRADFFYCFVIISFVEVALISGVIE